MSHLLFAVASRIDGRRTLDQIAAEAGAELGRNLTAADVAFLVDNKLRLSGLILMPGQTAAPKAVDTPILGLRYRARVVPPAVVHAATTLTVPLFNPIVVVGILIGIVLFDRWLLVDHGLAHATQQLIVHPTLVFAILGLTVASTALHELGHATACRYGGAKPGAIGAGIYLVWPCFYSDVTDSYRLSRAGRLRTDLGGVYFNLISVALLAGAYLFTRFEPLLLAIALIQADALHQFFPFFRLDGYYVASDLIGVPDLFMRMRPMLLSFIPGRSLHPQVRALKPWARYAVATWVFFTFVVIAGLYVLLVKALPRVLATAQESFMLHLVEIGYFWHHGSPGGVALAVIDEISLAFPLLALGATALFFGRRLLKMWTLLGDERPTVRMAVATAAAIVLVFVLPTMATTRDFRPIVPSDRGTVPPPHEITQWFGAGGGFAAGGSPGSPTPPSWNHQPSPQPVTSPSSAPSPSPGGSSGPQSTPVGQPPSPSVLPVDSPTPSPSDSASPSPSDSPSPSPSAT